MSNRLAMRKRTNMCRAHYRGNREIGKAVIAFSALAGRLSCVALVAIAAAWLPQNSRAATTAYWDANGINPGASPGGGSATGTWGTDDFWSTTSDGIDPGAWTDGDTAVFSAGTDASGAFTVTLGGTLPTAGGVTFEDGTVTLSSGTLTLNGSGVITVNATQGVIASQVSGSAGLTKAGAGELVLEGVNDFTGNLTLQRGTLTLDNDQAASSGAISISNDGGIGGAVTLRTTKTLTTLANNIDLGLANGYAIDFAPGSGNQLALNGVISGSHSWRANGAGTITLGGTSANTFPGAVTVAQGTLVVAKDNALGAALNGTVVNSGATLAFQGGIEYTDDEAVGISGTGVGSVGAINNVSGNNLFDGIVTLNSASSIGAAAGSLGFVGPVSGSYALTKVGSGIVDLFAQNNDYTTTLVSAGTLGVWYPANAGTGLATVSAGTRLEGNGSVPGGITLSGTISPGASPDILNSGSQTWDGGATYEWEINSVAGAAGGDGSGYGWDLLNITGGLSIGATPASKFNLKILSLDATNAPGAVTDFNNTQEYNWTIVATTTGVTSFDAAAFTLDDSAFSNDKGGGRFVILTNGNNLALRFDPRPVITCPGNITQTNDPSFCSAVVNFTGTATDNGPAPTIVCVPPSGATFPAGTTTVNCTATDSVGNTNTCSFTVTVKDTEPPTITGPANLPDVYTDPTRCYATGVNLGVPVATHDNCGILAVTNNAPAQFPKGVTTVTWTAVDTSGNVATWAQQVTVKDHEAPAITTCATNQILALGTNCTATIPDMIGEVRATDNCSTILTMSQSPPAGTIVAGPDPTIVSFTVKDEALNATTCTVKLRKVDQTPPTITAPPNMTNNANPGVCYATAVALGSPTTGDNCSVTNVSNNAPAQFPVGQTTVTWTVKDSSGNSATATQTVTVVDTMAPVITCVANKSVAYTEAWDFDGPSAMDLCGTNTITVLSTTTNWTCGAAYVATRAWQAVDAFGNSATCTQVVTVVDTTPPTILCPDNLTVECSSPWSFGTPVAADRGLGGALVYDNSVNDLSTRFDTGTNEVGNEILLAGEERYLQGFSYEFWSTNLTDSSLFEGTNVTVRLRFYANDGADFNGYPTPGTLLYDSGEFWLGMGTTPRATVVYDEFDLWLYALYPLMAAVPSDFTWTVQFSGLGTNDRAGVDLYSAPVIGQSYGDFWLRTNGGWQLRTNPAVAMDIAAQARASTNRVVITELSTVTNAIPGTGFGVTRTWRATDPCGNFSDCSQTVTVVDSTAPVITLCPTNRSLSLGTNCLLALPDFTGELVATDACSQVFVSQSPAAGTTVGLGQYVVTFTACDAASNSTTCALTLGVGVPEGANTNISIVGSISRLSDGAVQVDFTGFPCASHTLHSSTNLTDWGVLTTLFASADGRLTFVDSGATNGATRFFRLSLP
jgi:autotransporter-associated beta strand protein